MSAAGGVEGQCDSNVSTQNACQLTMHKYLILDMVSATCVKNAVGITVFPDMFVISAGIPSFQA